MERQVLKREYRFDIQVIADAVEDTELDVVHDRVLDVVDLGRVLVIEIVIVTATVTVIATVGDDVTPPRDRLDPDRLNRPEVIRAPDRDRVADLAQASAAHRKTLPTPSLSLPPEPFYRLRKRCSRLPSVLSRCRITHLNQSPKGRRLPR